MAEKTKIEEREVEVPEDLQQALDASCEAQTAWQELTTIGRRDFIAWIKEPKQPETRAKRVGRCIENLVKGKKRPCCFAVVPMDFYSALKANPEANARWTHLSATEKRDLTDWVQDTNDNTIRKSRIDEAMFVLASKKKLP